MEILPGSKIVGQSGKVLLVERIERGLLVCGDRLIKPSAVVRVIAPDPPQSDPPPAPKKPQPLAVGDTCYYCGSWYWQQYGGLELKAALLREGYWSCTKPDGYYTTNILPSELSRSPVAKPTKKSPERIPKAGRWMIESELEKAVDRAPDSCQHLGGYLEAAEEMEGDR
jgi:hypothetical protein